MDAKAEVIKAKLQPGDEFPACTLRESPQDEYGAACPLPPKAVNFKELIGNRKVVVCGIPGAFTSTCSEKHVPSFLQNVDRFKAQGVDEVFVCSVNDGWVMAEYARALKANNRVRFLGDADLELTRALGLEFHAPGMGQRCRRFSLLVNGGKIQLINVEQPGQYSASSAETLLSQMESKH
jgi:peroxiredoxin